MTTTSDRPLSELPLMSRRIVLRPMRADDVDDLYDLAYADTPAVGGTEHRPSKEAFARDFPEQCLSCLVIELRQSQKLVGFLRAYNPDLESRHAYVGTVIEPDYERRGIGAEASGLFVEYLFQRYGLVKLYVETMQPATRPSPEGTLLDHAEHRRDRRRQAYVTVLEGLLRRHRFFNGAWWDLHLYAIYPDDEVDGQ